MFRGFSSTSGRFLGGHDGDSRHITSMQRKLEITGRAEDPSQCRLPVKAGVLSDSVSGEPGPPRTGWSPLPKVGVTCEGPEV